ncbi:hypothetical protein [Paenibacillus algorifonticola]|uniref:hypothetical protein n=1 Tax=Paenibacillus algorifonticola TaxID=684063 RepID=UPI000B1ECD14|nr:hypothetical protein [Paenibacillus algorifonticola]
MTRNVYDAADNLIKVIDAKGHASAVTGVQRYGTVYSYGLANRFIAQAELEAALQNNQ